MRCLPNAQNPHTLKLLWQHNRSDIGKQLINRNSVVQWGGAPASRPYFQEITVVPECHVVKEIETVGIGIGGGKSQFINKEIDRQV
jgi:hypothetical protein